MKRYPVKNAKENSLRVTFGKIDGTFDIVCSWNNVDKCDSRLLVSYLSSKRYGFKGYPDIEPSLLKELIDRGYDIRTLEFSIKKLDADDEEGGAINTFVKQNLE